LLNDVKPISVRLRAYVKRSMAEIYMRIVSFDTSRYVRFRCLLFRRHLEECFEAWCNIFGGGLNISEEVKESLTDNCNVW
jgi:hypothetical protein